MAPPAVLKKAGLLKMLGESGMALLEGNMNLDSWDVVGAIG